MLCFPISNINSALTENFIYLILLKIRRKKKESIVTYRLVSIILKSVLLFVRTKIVSAQVIIISNRICLKKL